MTQGLREEASSVPLDLNPIPATFQLWGLRPATTLLWASHVHWDDHSTCHIGLLEVINIHISCGRRVFFLDGMAWPFQNRMFCCREQRGPVSRV